jgi:catechol 2,3-dioxygenase-like lactoylglutathione lyase family enzyme
MIDHIGFAVSDYERAKAFYASGYPAAGFGIDGKPRCVSSRRARGRRQG